MVIIIIVVVDLLQFVFKEGVAFKPTTSFGFYEFRTRRDFAKNDRLFYLPYR